MDGNRPPDTTGDRYEDVYILSFGHLNLSLTAFKGDHLCDL